MYRFVMASSGGSSSSSSHDEDDDLSEFLEYLQFLAVKAMLDDKPRKIPQRNCPFTGQMYVDFLLDGHPSTIHDILRMKKDPFLSLCHVLVEGGFLNVGKMWISIEQAVSIFLYIVGGNTTHWYVADRFQHSTKTICRIFRKIMRALCYFGNAII